MTKQYRQGDVFIEEVNELPKGCIKNKDDVILEGEATGHHHRLEGGQIMILRDFRTAPSMFLVIPDMGKIVHEEHAIIDLPKGIYRVTRQREYSPYGIRNVMD